MIHISQLSTHVQGRLNIWIRWRDLLHRPCLIWHVKFSSVGFCCLFFFFFFNFKILIFYLFSYHWNFLTPTQQVFETSQLVQFALQRRGRPPHCLSSPLFLAERHVNDTRTGSPAYQQRGREPCEKDLNEHNRLCCNQSLKPCEEKR